MDEKITDEDIKNLNVVGSCKKFAEEILRTGKAPETFGKITEFIAEETKEKAARKDPTVKVAREDIIIDIQKDTNIEANDPATQLNVSKKGGDDIDL